jgi:hypothetical protein
VPYSRAQLDNSHIALRAYLASATQSRALDLADKYGIPRSQIDQLGMDISNGTIRIQDYRSMSKDVQALGQVRRLEIEQEMRKLRDQTSIVGDDVYAALKKVNPNFGATLGMYVNGNARVPASAWHNPNYKDNILTFGARVDPSMSEFTFKNKADTIANFTKGRAWQNVINIGTAYRHIGMLDSMVATTPHAPGGVGGRLVPDIISDKVQQWFGAADNPARNWLARWDTISQTAAEEIAKANAGTGASAQAQRDEWLAKFRAASSEDEKRNVIAAAKDLMNGKLTELEASFRAGTGRDPVRGIANILARTRGALSGDIQGDADRVKGMLDNRGWDAVPE